MISEQRIIELAKFHANEVYQDYAGFTFKQLQEFANALQDEFIKSLLEVGSMQNDMRTGHTYNILFNDGMAQSIGTKLYALPNEEVK